MNGLNPHFINMGGDGFLDRVFYFLPDFFHRGLVLEGCGSEHVKILLVAAIKIGYKRTTQTHQNKKKFAENIRKNIKGRAI